ncbi:hypothetical protein [Chelativorans sp. M5D2P16]|uniref:hypothetical protein n=1 Tax=Chelativorans sp. M5D2P16 TaxID=3095678 RepID=UPI002ACA33F9|nr:hypothetical protein [Chelativorans sp. M5D2P16]MDZ5697623.1 hypothetical protein [Chelativorans sp. M5D2P16]
MLNGRPVPISIQRFHTGEKEATWHFSPFAVQHVSDVFFEIKPGLLGRWIPLRERLKSLGRPSIWEWSAASALLLAAVLFGLLVRFLARLVSRRMSPLRAQKAQKLVSPLAILSAALAFRAGTQHLFLLTGPVAAYLDIVSDWSRLQREHGCSCGSRTFSRSG